MYILIAILAVLAFILYSKLFKIPKVGNMILITGGIKTGKSTLSVHLVKRTYKKQLRNWKIRKFIYKIKRNLNKDTPILYIEKPLIYSNVPLNMEYVPLTKELLERKERFAYGSVCYVCEASLVADSMSYKDPLLNERLLLLNKLFAHETKGGYIVYDTQSISDNHYAVKRCLSTYLYVHHTIRIPFFLIMYVKELHYSDDNNVINTNSKDAEEDLKRIIVPKSVWKDFDCYCYSALTDNLPRNNKSLKNRNKSLKADNIISFKDYKTLGEPKK